jgi:signal transduction histidine kinase
MSDTARDAYARTGIHKEECVVIIAPFGNDAAAMAALLEGEGFETRISDGSHKCAGQLMNGAGALLLTEEALQSAQASLVLEILKGQPPWSELPFIILTSGGESQRAGLLNVATAAAGAVTLLERPISTLTLIRSVQVALRSRRRQYQVRDLVIELANLNQTLERRVAERTRAAVEQAEKLRLLSAELSIAEEAERRRIADILHEDLQQLIVAARMQLAALCKTQDAARREAMAGEITEVLQRAFNLTRSLTVELAPPVLHEGGLAAALEWLAAEARKNYNVDVTLEADPLANPEVPDVSIFLFRAVRELLLNSVKHAVGSAVHITMQHLGPDKIRIIVADDGPGFNPASLDSQSTSSQKFGLLNLRERVHRLGGEFNITSGPNCGTRVMLSLLRGSARGRSDQLIAQRAPRRVSSVSLRGARQSAARSSGALR